MLKKKFMLHFIYLCTCVSAVSGLYARARVSERAFLRMRVSGQAFTRPRLRERSSRHIVHAYLGKSGLASVFVRTTVCFFYPFQGRVGCRCETTRFFFFFFCFFFCLAFFGPFAGLVHALASGALAYFFWDVRAFPSIDASDSR